MVPQDPLTPQILLKTYAAGAFFMAERRDDPTLYRIDPPLRGIIPLDGFHVPRRLQRSVRQDIFTIHLNTDFAAVIDGCAAAGSGPTRGNTWINGRLKALYLALHKMGHAHSIEAHGPEGLAGGLFGVSVGGAFFGESMFSRARDASKVALVHLVARLKAGGFRLLDTQFITAHLQQFGAIEIPRAEYLALLRDAIAREGDLYSLDRVLYDSRSGFGRGGGAGGGTSSITGSGGAATGAAEALGAGERPRPASVGASVLQLTTQTS
ncbi:MAG: leucyl/phenylalanyl-tRNA--protein transferase [Alphaproteobacteria bacterium]|nr:leucyl/phenylalanyl-tRNA--protein transferase [Alphaproteobacteria bacterium]